MSLNLQKSSLGANVLVKIELDGETIRLAKRDIVARDLDGEFYFWEGRIQSISDFVSGFDDVEDANAILANLSVSLFVGKRSDTDEDANGLFLNKRLALKRITVFVAGTGFDYVTVTSSSVLAWRVGPALYMGPELYIRPRVSTPTVEAVILDASAIIFKGVFGFPDSIESWDEEVITIKVYEPRYLNQIKFCSRVFGRDITALGDQTQFNDLLVGQRKPVIYGRFMDKAVIPAWKISELEYQVADEEDKSSLQQFPITRVGYTNGGFIRLFFTQEARFESVSATEYGVGALELEPLKAVALEGKSRGALISGVFGGSNSAVLENPVEIAYEIMVYKLGFEASEINEASFISVAALRSENPAKRWIGNEETVVDVLNELLFEFALGLIYRNGQVEMIAFDPFGPVVKSFDQYEIERESYGASRDVNRLYFDSIELRFEPDYFKGPDRRVAFYEDQIEAQINDNANELTRTNLWNHEEVSAISTWSSLSSVFTQPLDQVTFKAAYTSFNIQPGSMIELSFHIFERAKLLVRRVEKNLESFQSLISAWFIKNNTVKAYTDTPDFPFSFSAAVGAPECTLHASSEIVFNWNNTFQFVTDAPYQVFLAPGAYLPKALAAHIEERANASATNPKLVVSYDEDARRFSIDTVDGSDFDLIVSGSDTTERLHLECLGFDSDKSGGVDSQPYESERICIFESVEAVSVWQ